MLIDADRDPIPDVPAIYFVMPTVENVRLIGADCSRQLYDSYHVNFASPASTVLLEELAKLALEAEAVSQISQVVDHYVDYVSLEDQLVDFNMRDSFLSLNDPSTPDDVVLATVDSIVTAVFSIVATLGQVPVMRYPRGGPAEMVADKVAKRIREHLRQNAAFLGDSGSTASFQRPLLVLMERSADLGPLLQHPWSYRALCHDLLGMRLNRLTCQEEAEDGSSQPKTHHYTLEMSDAFWNQHAGSPFTTVAEAVDVALQNYRSEVEAIGSAAQQRGASAGAEDLDSHLSQSTQQLQSAMSALPALQERKRNIDMHTNIATALLHKIRNCSLDLFVGAEEAILGGRPSSQDRAEVEKLIREGAHGLAEDRLRLLCLYFLCCRPPDADLQPLVEALSRQQVDLRPFTYLKQMMAFRSTVSTAVQPADQEPAGVMKSVFKVSGAPPPIVPALWSMLSEPPAHPAGHGWVGHEPHLHAPGECEGAPAGKAGDAHDGYRLCPHGPAAPPGGGQYARTLAGSAAGRWPAQLSAWSAVAGFLTLDPKLGADAQAGEGGRRGAYRDAIVVMIGGGNYLEFQNLMEHAQRHQNKKRVLYVCTELRAGTEFVGQLAKLAKP